MFETLIVQPIFNLLIFLYAFVGDFGVAIILFTALIRLLMWPMLRKQLHQSRKMRQLAPDIKAIRKKHKGGDRQVESMELMNLYKKHGVNPVGSIGLLFVQLPIFFGLFSALRSIINSPERLIRMPYSYVRDNADVNTILETVAEKTNGAIEALQNADLKTELMQTFGSPVTPDSLNAVSKEELINLYDNTLQADGSAIVEGPFFNQELFGFIDLSGSAISDAGIYIPVLIIAVLAGVFQYFQTKQLTPTDDNAKSLREIMKESAASGKEPDQSEVSAAVGRRMGIFFAPLITFISASAPSGLALYFASSGLVALLQQRAVLNQDLDEMEIVADVTESKPKAETKNKNQNKNKKKGSGSKKSKKKKR